jgi:hypothetical protein
MCQWNEFQKTFYFMTIFVTNIHIVSYNSITSQVGAVVVVGFITTCTYVITMHYKKIILWTQISLSFLFLLHQMGTFFPVIREITHVKNLIKHIILESNREYANDRDKVCQWLATGRWFSPVSYTNKTDRHNKLKYCCKWH